MIRGLDPTGARIDRIVDSVAPDRHTPRSVQNPRTAWKRRNGEVYRARDTRLHRDVAVWIVPPQFAADAERVARFEREAHVVAALNHQNIAQIYGIEETAGVSGLVMELVEGPMLADLIGASAGMPVDDALDVARQIAEGLEAARRSRNHPSRLETRECEGATRRGRESSRFRTGESDGGCGGGRPGRQLRQP